MQKVLGTRCPCPTFALFPSSTESSLAIWGGNYRSHVDLRQLAMSDSWSQSHFY